MRMVFLTVCVLVWMSATATAGELLQSPEKASSWKLEVAGQAAGSVTEEQGTLRFDVTQTDETDCSGLPCGHRPASQDSLHTKVQRQSIRFPGDAGFIPTARASLQPGSCLEAATGTEHSMEAVCNPCRDAGCRRQTGARAAVHPRRICRKGVGEGRLAK
jgi:hypothetical protein